MNRIYVFTFFISLVIVSSQINMKISQSSLNLIMYTKSSGLSFSRNDRPRDNKLNIVDSLRNYPCAQTILSILPGLTKETKAVFYKIFESDKETSIRYYPDFSLSGTLSDGKTSGTGSLIFKYRIGVNVDVLKHGTKEYVLAALLHETLHVYLLHHINLYNTGQLDSTTFKNEFHYFWKLNKAGKITRPSEEAEHHFIAEEYIMLIKNAVKVYNPSIADEFALAISWGGLEKTNAYFKQSAGKRIFELNLLARDTGYATDPFFRFEKGYRYSDFAATKCL
jgi:hypothetical protein